MACLISGLDDFCFELLVNVVCFMQSTLRRRVTDDESVKSLLELSLNSRVRA